MAGLLRRGTPDHLLLEGDDDGGGDDLFGDDEGGSDEGSDDSGDDDIFGDDEGGDSGDEEKEEEEEPVEELPAADIKKFGSPIFQELENSLEDIFQNALKAGPVRAQEIQSYPGGSDADDEDEVEEGLAKEGYNRREIRLVLEARRLLNEAENKYSADKFDMSMYAQHVADLITHRETKLDLPGAIYNASRQMIINHFGREGQIQFDEYFEASLDTEDKKELGISFDSPEDLSGGADVPTAVGAGGDGGGV